MSRLTSLLILGCLLTSPALAQEYRQPEPAPETVEFTAPAPSAPARKPLLQETPAPAAQTTPATEPDFWNDTAPEQPNATVTPVARPPQMPVAVREVPAAPKGLFGRKSESAQQEIARLKAEREADAQKIHNISLQQNVVDGQLQALEERRSAVIKELESVAGQLLNPGGAQK